MSTVIPVERLWELYDYSPFTGQLWSKRYKRPLTGTPKHGALGVWINGYSTNYGRVVFAWCVGRWPEGQIDHINRDWTNNHFWNLRECTARQNNHNKAVFNGGANFDKAKGRWRAQIRLTDKRKHLGYFSTKAEAQEAYASALERLSPR